MLGPSTSSERSTVNAGGHYDPNVRNDYEVEAAAAAAASAAVNAGGFNDEANQFHQQHQGYSAAAAAAAAELQHRAERQRIQQQLQQQELHHQQQLQYQQQQHHHQQQQQQQLQYQQQQQHHQLHQQPQLPEDYEGILQSRYIENEIIKTFTNKPDLIKFVKFQLSNDERCKIVINSSKPKAVYFQCERSGSFRTTVKDATKRQRVAYTKRNKCGYRLVANLYPPEKDKKKIKKQSPDPNGLDRNLDDKLGQFTNSLDENESLSNEMWILRMINPMHNHPPEPLNGKKKRGKTSRTLVEKPLHRNLPVNNNAYPNESLNQIAQHAHHLVHQHIPPHLHHEEPHHHSVQDAAVIAAIEATPAAAAAAALQNQQAVDPNIDPNVDPSVQAHDHSHGMRNPHLMRR